MKDLFQLLQQPTFLLYAALGVAIAWMWRKRTESRKKVLALTIPYVLLGLATTRVAGYWVQATLASPYPPIARLPDDAEAVVVLAGYAFTSSNVYQHADLGSDTLHRCELAAELCADNHKILLVTSGGPVQGDTSQPSIAALMRDYLVQRGVDGDQILVESISQNTYENAVESCKLLGERKIHRIVLVTDAEHMRRSVACFQKQGMEVTAAPTRFHELALGRTAVDYVPNPREAGDFEMGFHEWLGIAYYRLRGRL